MHGDYGVPPKPKDLTPEEQLVPDGATVVLPPYGFVHLQACCATDLDVVNAARVSLGKQSEWWITDPSDDGEKMPLSVAKEHYGYPPKGIHRTLSQADEGLVHYLLKNKHGTPFEHTFFKFHVRAPIFVFREWHRHRIGVSINEESARYSELQPHFYEPEKFRVQEGRAGRYTYRDVEDHELATTVRSDMRAAYEVAWTAYQHMLRNGVARELARTVLPVGIYSQMIWSCNARSLMNFLTLRNAPTAQREIRLYAEAMERIFAEQMPVTHEAFVVAGRVAP